MPTEASETLEDIIAEPVLCTIHDADVELSLHDQVWDDGSYLFFGYNAKNDPLVTIAGQIASLQVEIIPDGAPERTHPFLSAISEGEAITWYENALKTLSSAFVFLREFEEKRFFLLDGSLNSETEKYYNRPDLQDRLDTFSSVMRDNSLPFSRKAEQLAPVLTDLEHILAANRIPDELKYEESLFYLIILRLQKHVQWLIGETGKTEENDLPGFSLRARHLADVLKNIKDDHENVARGRIPVPTNEEKAAILKILEEHAGIMAMEKGSQEAIAHIGRELELCQKIWTTPFVDWQTRLDSATRAVNLISDAINDTEAAALESKKRHAAMPELSRYIKEANVRIKELDETGYAAITGPIADRFLANINETRRSLEKAPLTREELAAVLKINSIRVSITEKDGALSTSICLYLADNSYTYALHYLSVLISNGRIQEMKILGK